MAGVERERRQDGQDLIAEVLLEVLAPEGADVARAQQQIVIEATQPAGEPMNSNVRCQVDAGIRGVSITIVPLP